MDTLRLIDTLIDTVRVRDTLVLVKDGSQSWIAITAIATAALAFLTFVTIIVTLILNKRDRDRRLLTYASLKVKRRTEHPQMWDFIVKNIGFGPVSTKTIEVIQDEKIIEPDPDDTSKLQVGLDIGDEAKIRYRFNSYSMVKINIVFYDLLGKRHSFPYEWNPPSKLGGPYEQPTLLM